MDKNTLLGVLLGTLLGGAISFFFYWQSGQELRAEAERLRRLNVLILRGMEDAGLARFTRDASGELVGIVINVGASVTGKSSVSASATVTPAASPEKPEGAAKR